MLGGCLIGKLAYRSRRKRLGKIPRARTRKFWEALQLRNEQQTQALEALFEPYKVRRLTIPNRIVMSPMARAFSPDGVPGEDVAAYYSRRAENEVGLVITEGAVIGHPAAASESRLPDMFGEAALAGWGRVVRLVHEAGARFSRSWCIWG